MKNLLFQLLSLSLVDANETPEVYHYYPNWAGYLRDFNAWWLPVGKTTGALYAFFEIDKNCILKSIDEDADYKNGDSWGGIVEKISNGTIPIKSNQDGPRTCGGHRNGLAEAIEKAENGENYKLLMSIGGASKSAYISKCLKSAARRSKLILSIEKMAVTWGGLFTGIDLDWEYPGKYDEYGDERPGVGISEDMKNWSDFIKEMKVRMPQMTYTTALFMNPTLIRESFSTSDFCHVLNGLDRIFTMSYDFYGSWSNVTNHHAPLFDDPANPELVEGFSVAGSLMVFTDLWDSKCRSIYNYDVQSKIIMGLPAYGRTWNSPVRTEVKQGLPGLYSPVSANNVEGPGSFIDRWEQGYGVIDYFDVRYNYLKDDNTPVDGLELYHDYDYTFGSYLIGKRADGICCLVIEDEKLNPLFCDKTHCGLSGDYFISFDSDVTIAYKSSFAHSAGFAGVMFWEASGDRLWNLTNRVYHAWNWDTFLSVSADIEAVMQPQQSTLPDVIESKLGSPYVPFFPSTVWANCGPGYEYPEREPASDPLVYHYYPNWGVWSRDFNAFWLPAKYTTGALYSFFNLNESCEVVTSDSDADFKKGPSWGGVVEQYTWMPTSSAGTWDDQGCSGNRAHFIQLKEKFPDYEVLMSLGGWSFSKYFSKCSKDLISRRKIAGGIKTLAVWPYNMFDGVDIDWEYPGKYDDNGNERPLKDVDVDIRNWVELLKEIKTQNPEMKLTSALGMSVDLLEEEFKTIEFCHVLDMLDIIFTMSYDFYGAWARTTGHNAPLYDDPANPILTEGFSVAGSLDKFISLWESKCRSTYDYDITKKMVLGLPAYGRSWNGVSLNQRKPGLPGLYTEVTEVDIDGPGSIVSNKDSGRSEGYGTLDFWDINNKYLLDENVLRFWDDVGKVPYLVGRRTDKICCLVIEEKEGADSQLCEQKHCGRTGEFFISYDDEESIYIKSEYAKSKGLAGVMFWEASGDRQWNLLNAAYAGWGSFTTVPDIYHPVGKVLYQYCP